MVQMTTLKRHRYSGKALVAGDSFEATRRDARLLVALGRAETAVAAPVAAPMPAAIEEPKRKKREPDAVEPAAETVEVVMAELVAESAANAQDETATEADEAVKPKRQYKRRDMVAE